MAPRGRSYWTHTLLLCCGRDSDGVSYQCVPFSKRLEPLFRMTASHLAVTTVIESDLAPLCICLATTVKNRQAWSTPAGTAMPITGQATWWWRWCLLLQVPIDGSFRNAFRGVRSVLVDRLDVSHGLIDVLNRLTVITQLHVNDIRVGISLTGL